MRRVDWRLVGEVAGSVIVLSLFLLTLLAVAVMLAPQP